MDSWAAGDQPGATGGHYGLDACAQCGGHICSGAVRHFLVNQKLLRAHAYHPFGAGDTSGLDHFYYSAGLIHSDNDVAGDMAFKSVLGALLEPFVVYWLAAVELAAVELAAVELGTWRCPPVRLVQSAIAD